MKRAIDENFELLNERREREGKKRIKTFEDLEKEREEEKKKKEQ